eukprot:UN23803
MKSQLSKTVSNVILRCLDLYLQLFEFLQELKSVTKNSNYAIATFSCRLFTEFQPKVKMDLKIVG